METVTRMGAASRQKSSPAPIPFSQQPFRDNPKLDKADLRHFPIRDLFGAAADRINDPVGYLSHLHQFEDDLA
jgi:hypothetical protein